MGEEGSEDDNEAPQVDASVELDEYLMALDEEDVRVRGFEEE